MADKVYVLSDGSTEIVPPEDEQVFFKELEDNGLTATLQEPELGNQISSTEDATVEQNPTASNQEVENGEYQYQSEEVQSSSVSPADQRRQEKLQAFNEHLKSLGIDPSEYGWESINPFEATEPASQEEKQNKEEDL